MPEILICRTDEVEDGAVRIVTIDTLELGLIRHKGRFFAYRNVCAHQGGPACDGLRLPQVEDVIDEGGAFLQQRFNDDDIHIVCPWHGYEYHLTTGEHVVDKRLRLEKFDVSVRDGNVYVTV